ncbi:TetR/AcrR family transcriptional regulator [uncultured Litoreibacter sp.]|uniref:TetR/AcrR family transcriptional regulator n=1 Tax=uncultured Litoreibacter sp. TaxID=1392394 RepID=UPI002630E36D|nr:TetR/AcrR family transcriptional regulator [uncultured Litoreibacter sp.]
MREKLKDQRRAEIEATALELLRKRGYEAASMLNIAKAAKASNETLYRWYGDKQRLFLEVVKSVAAETEKRMDKVATDDLPPKEALRDVGRTLLTVVLGDTSVTINRAAAADSSGKLGAAISRGGREKVFPRLVNLMTALREGGLIAPPSDEQAAVWFSYLLIGDLQTRRITGILPQPTRKQINEHVDSALEAFYKVCAPPTSE